MLPFKQYLSESCDCWKGYKRKPGTKPCSPGSCVKEEVNIDEAHTHELTVSYDKNLQRARGKVRVTADSHEEAKEKALSSMAHEKNVKVHTSKSPDSSIEHHFKEEVDLDESSLNKKDPHGDYRKKRKVLDDLAKNKDANQKDVQQRRLSLDTEYASHNRNALLFKREEVELDESVTDSWKTVQSMDKGSVAGSTDQVKKRLAYLKAVHAHHKKFGNDTHKVRKEIESINRSKLAEELEEQFDLIEEYVEELSLTLDVHADAIWEKFESVDDVELYEAAVDAKGHKSSTGGLTQKGRDAYNAKGANLQAPVTTPPSKLKSGSKAANRRKSFCARMGGMEGPMKDDKGRPTRKALALRKWNC
jgi:hypothetical protein